MTEPVEWHPDGRPFSARFQEGYHSEAGAVAQARHVFLGGCGLPGAWANAPQWRILETGFGLGLNFLTSWQAWKQDPARPGLLHFVSVDAYPVSREDILRASARYEELAPLVRQLADQWHGLLPGFHRLAFEGAIEVDQMQATAATLDPLGGHAHRVVGKYGGVFHATLAQTHAGTVLQIDSRDTQHLGNLSNQ